MNNTIVAKKSQYRKHEEIRLITSLSSISERLSDSSTAFAFISSSLFDLLCSPFLVATHSSSSPENILSKLDLKTVSTEIILAIIKRNKSTHQYFQAQRHVTLFGSRMHHLNPLPTNQNNNNNKKTRFLNFVS